MLKHTDFIPSLSISVRVVVVVVKLWPHAAKGRLAHAARTANWAHVPSRWHHRRACGTSHVWGVRGVLNCLAVVDLGHPSDAPTSQPRVLVTVPPAVDGPLDQATLSTEARVQLSSAQPTVLHSVSYTSLLPRYWSLLQHALGYTQFSVLNSGLRVSTLTDSTSHRMVYSILTRSREYSNAIHWTPLLSWRTTNGVVAGMGPVRHLG